MMERVEKILVTKEQISERVRQMGEQISRDYAGKEPYMVCILKGSIVFFADLIRHVDLTVVVDTMVVSSYGKSTISSGNVRVKKDLAEDIAGRDVIIVEDIIDSGHTLSALTKMLRDRNPASLKVATFLDKPSRRKVEFQGDYVGFEIPDEFVVGYGLDYDERYRNLPYVGVLSVD
ncbi:MAG: hypoxanthine phosphoribosyltransferase [Christensenellales bacterium]